MARSNRKYTKYTFHKDSFPSNYLIRWKMCLFLILTGKRVALHVLYVKTWKLCSSNQYAMNVVLSLIQYGCHGIVQLHTAHKNARRDLAVFIFQHVFFRYYQLTQTKTGVLPLLKTGAGLLSSFSTSLCTREILGSSYWIISLCKMSDWRWWEGIVA